MLFNSETEFNRKREEVFARFSREFLIGNYDKEPVLKAIIHSLIENASPYAIIEQLIYHLKETRDEMMRLRVYGPPPQIILKEK